MINERGLVHVEIKVWYDPEVTTDNDLVDAINGEPGVEFVAGGATGMSDATYDQERGTWVIPEEEV